MISVRKSTKNHGVLLIKPIHKTIAREIIIAGHYSHKWQPTFGIHNFGIFRESDPSRCLGVAAYGLMKSPKAKIFTSDVPGGWMIELNRMWIDDELGKNAETILIGASLRLLRECDPTIVAVQSFADGRIGCGTIYKAANFDYYGWHWTRFFRNKITGEVTHNQNITNATGAVTFMRTNTQLLCGELEPFLVKTHRYIYPLHKSFVFTSGKRQPYPPYERGEHETKFIINPATLRSRLYRTIDTLLDRYPHHKQATSPSGRCDP